MDVYSFVEGPLLWIAFLTFLIGSLFKASSFFFVSRKTDQIIYRYFNWKYVLMSVWRWLLPIHKDVAKNPVLTICGYVFHVCIIIIPIWFSGHVVLWEESRFEWVWTPIPDSLSDWLTLIFLAIALFFFLRRIVSPDIRLISTVSDYVLLIVTTLPFLTGYFVTHGTMDNIPLLGNNILLIHMLSAEFMLILIPFTKLSHYILFFFSRGATGVEFGRRGYSV